MPFCATAITVTRSASNEAAVSRNSYLGYETGFSGGGRRELAWAVAPQFSALRIELDAFLATRGIELRENNLADRMFGGRFFDP